MSSTYISAELRRLVMERANRLCEYCLIHEDDTFFGCQADHIISEKHGGLTQSDNLALACSVCNRHKGSDVGSIDWATGDLVRFFNPRRDLWQDHFAWNEVEIVGITPVGVVTVRILRFNDLDRLLERQALQMVGRYPSPEAIAYLTD